MNEFGERDRHISEMSFEFYQSGKGGYLVKVLRFLKGGELLVKDGVILKPNIKEYIDREELTIIGAQLEESFLKQFDIEDSQRIFIMYQMDRELIYRIFISNTEQEIPITYYEVITNHYGAENFIVLGDTFIFAKDFYMKQQGKEVQITRLKEEVERIYGETFMGDNLEDLEKNIEQKMGREYLDNMFYEKKADRQRQVDEDFEEHYALDMVDEEGLLESLVQDKNSIMRTQYNRGTGEYEFAQKNILLIFKDISEVANFVGSELRNDDIDLTLYTMDKKFYLVVNYPQYMDTLSIYAERIRLTEYMNISGRTVEYLGEYGELILEDDKIRGVLKTLI